MSVLVGGIAGASSRLGGGLSAVSALAVSDVQPTAMQRVPASIGVRDGPVLGRFRRSLNGFSLDGFGVALAAVTVLIYDWTTKLLVAQLTTDAAGFFDYPIYAEGTTYFYYFNKAGAVEVFTTSSSQMVPV